MKKHIFGFIINIIIAAVLSAGAAFFPYASVLIMAVSTIFFMVCAYTHKISETLILLIASLLAIIAAKCSLSVNADNLFTSTSLFCLTSLSGAVIGLLTKFKSSFRMVIAGGTFANLASFLIDFAVLKFRHNLDLGEELINKPVADFFEVYSQILSSANISGAENIIEVMGDLQWYMQQMLATVVPSVLIILCAFFAYVTFVIGRKFIFKKHGVVMENYPHFWQLQLPRSASMALAVLFIVTFFMNSSPVAGAITNIIIILCALYMLCGLSVVDFFLRKKRFHWAIRIVIYVIAFTVLSVIGVLIPVANAPSLLLFTGVIDGLFDFRRLRSGGEKYEA
ncbi:MAG: DUF2232 domain-containing protein [Clostridia bacterium]|nr:DUF2232 domain-containing protein [Clostridia bacterium]